MTFLLFVKTKTSIISNINKFEIQKTKTIGKMNQQTEFVRLFMLKSLNQSDFKKDPLLIDQ